MAAVIIAHTNKAPSFFLSFFLRYSRVRPEASLPTEAAIGDVPAEAMFARDDSVSPDSWVKDRTTGVYTLELTTPGIASKSVHVHIVGKTMFIEARSATNERLYFLRPFYRPFLCPFSSCLLSPASRPRLAAENLPSVLLSSCFPPLL